MNDKQKSIENMLKSHKPQADSKFQNNLEQQLMARLHEQYGTKEEETVMMMKRKRNTRSRLPLTLAAAILAIMLVGGLVIFLRMPPTSDVMPAAESYPNQFELTGTQLIIMATKNAAIELVTPTREPDRYELTDTALIREVTEIASGTLSSQAVVPETMNVMVALNTINTGDIITAETVTMISVEADTMWQVAANTGGTWYYGDINQVLGRKANATIAPFEPITDQNTVDAETQVTVPTEDESSIPIIIAAQDIAIGEVIDETMVYRVFYPRPVAGDAIPRNQHFGGFFGNFEDVTGKVAIVPIRAFTPIDDNAIAVPRTNAPRVLPDGQVAVAIPFNETMARFYIQNGQSVRIISSLSSTDLQGDYPDALREYTDSNLDAQQITVSVDATVLTIDETGEFTPYIGESVITLAMTPNEAQLLLWLVNAGMPITFAVTGEDDTNIVPYYLPPEGFIGDYARVANESHVQVLVFIPADAEVNSAMADDGNNTLIFESFVNIGTYTNRDEEGNIIETGTSARLLVDVIYAEMLETLRLRNIPYTYRLLPLTLTNSQVRTSDDDYILVVPPPEHALLPCYAPHRRGGQAQVIFVIPNYETLPLEGIINQSGIGILFLDAVSLSINNTVCRDNFDISEGFLRLLLAPEDAGIFDILEKSGIEYHYAVLSR